MFTTYISFIRSGKLPVPYMDIVVIVQSDAYMYHEHATVQSVN